MPTNGTVVPAVQDLASRPSRPQLACPDDTSTSHAPGGWPQEEDDDLVRLHHRDVASPSPCPSEGEVVATTEDEKLFTPTTAATAVLAAPPLPQRAIVVTATAATSTAVDDTESSSAAMIKKKLFASRRASSKPNSAALEAPYFSSSNYDFSTKRVLPSYSCSFLRPGSKFVGKQTSDRSTYEVHVELKHVNMADSFLCGYLRIKGLTEDHPTLTTYFEGEMIGDKYSFQTRRPEWGSNEKNDFQHWSRFTAFRPLSIKAKGPDFTYAGFAQEENIFMRWKEYFLVPDHRVRQISGASFEGFYYICFNQVSGTVEGIYFHAKSEKFQRLQLKHVPERTFSCMEFR